MYDKINKGEQTACKRLVRILLNKGYKLSVYDGEDWQVLRSTDEVAIIDALGNTDMDTVQVNSDGFFKGSFMLVWGNAEDGSELIADHTDNPFCNDVWETWAGIND